MNSQSATLHISGMTCGHCVSSVVAELSGVPGVSGVAVELKVGGLSEATVTTTAPVAAADLAAAVADAGYAVVA